MSASAFSGWPKAALEYYVGLEATNTRDYFVANRAVFDESVRAPFLALSSLVEREFGPLHVFRPQRDVRFSKDKTPYKTAQGAVTEGEGGTMYYVQISAEGLFVASGYYRMAPDQLERYRAAVAQPRLASQLERIVADLRGRRYDVGGDALKTVPRGFPRDHPAAELLRYKGVTAAKQPGAPAWLHTAKAAERITDMWRGAAPLHRWLDRHVGPSALPPDDA